MAFKMNPKSPLLMKAMGIASPAKNMNKGYGPAKTSSPAKQKSGNSMTAAEKKAMNDRSIFGPDKDVAKPPKSKTKSKYDIDTTTPKKGNKNVKGEKYGASPAKQTAKQKANLPKEIVKAIAAKSPAKQAKITDAMYKKRDMKLYGDLNKTEFDKEANRQINVRNKRFKNAKAMSKANSGGTQTQTDYFGGQTSDGSCSREDDACNTKGQSIRKRNIPYDVPKRKMLSAGATLKADKIKTPELKGNLAGAKEIKVTKKAAKPTRSQKIRAKGEAALASGNTDKAQRLRRRYDRVEARKAKKAARKAARA